LKPKVYVTRRLPDSVLDRIAAVADLQFFSDSQRPVPREELLKAVEGVDGILSMLTEKMDGEVFEAAGPQLKVVANMAVGYDNIVLADAKAHRVIVTNTPDVLTETTADLTFALVLATARRVTESERFLRDGKWQTWSPMLLTGQDVFGATLGIIGMGRIGEAVVKRARGFDMNVLYSSRSPHSNVELEYGCTFQTMDEVLKKSDFVVVLTPLTEQTRGFIGARELSLMKPTAILINTARGPIVDERALYDALAKKQICAAGLDVFEQEPIAPDHPFLRLDNVVLLPHIGSASVQTRLRMANLATTNLLEAVLHGNPPNRVV